MNKDFVQMFNILDEYLKDKVQEIDLTILEAVNTRKNGKSFSFEEHLRGFVYAQISALVSWKKIKDNQSRLDEIFCNFDRMLLPKLFLIPISGPKIIILAFISVCLCFQI